jgi:hypothetical protein
VNRFYYSESVGASVRCLRDWLFVYLTICGLGLRVAA